MHRFQQLDDDVLNFFFDFSLVQYNYHPSNFYSELITLVWNLCDPIYKMGGLF